jgi:deazaflavin-dependent oxidoreductase (nitroreductase family)
MIRTAEVHIMRVLMWLLVILIAIPLAGFVFVKVVFVRESTRQRLFPVLRPLYKAANSRALRDAERGQSRWAVVHHVGRRSGALYDTPIDAQRTPDGVIICLVYGASADWCRNILAAGQCTLTMHGEELSLTSPIVISLQQAEPYLDAKRAQFWHDIGIEHCLQLRLTQSTRLRLAT